MKKMLITGLLVVVMLMTAIPVTVHAESVEGLKSTWYQAYNEDDEPVADHGGAIGGLIDSDDIEDFEYLFDGTIEVGEVMVPTFEIRADHDASMRPAGISLREYAAMEGMNVALIDGDVNGVFIVFEGFITAKETGEYKLFSNYVDNGCVVYIDGKCVFDFWWVDQWLDSPEAETAEGTAFTLEAGKPTYIKVYYFEQGGGQVLSFDITKDGGEKQEFNKMGFTFSYDEDSIPAPTEKPTPSPTTQAPATTAPARTNTPSAQATTTAASSGSDSQTGMGSMLPIIIAVAAVAVIAVVIVIVVVSKKKKS